MKLTKNKLKEIIREEIQNLQEKRLTVKDLEKARKEDTFYDDMAKNIVTKYLAGREAGLDLYHLAPFLNSMVKLDKKGKLIRR